MDQAFKQFARKGTQIGRHSSDYLYSEQRGYGAVRAKSNTALSLFYKQNKEIVIRVGVLLFLFLLSNVVTGLVVKTKVENRLTADYQLLLQNEVEASRAQIEADVRATYGADEVDAQTAQYNREVELLAKLIYPYINLGCSDNGLRSAVWCVLSRAGNRAYPNSVEEVILQKDQWMGFSEDNPVLQRAWDIASEQLTIYYSGGPIPVDPSFVFLNWSGGEITLRDSFDGRCHYWFESDWEALGYK